MLETQSPQRGRDNEFLKWILTIRLQIGKLPRKFYHFVIIESWQAVRSYGRRAIRPRPAGSAYPAHPVG